MQGIGAGDVTSRGNLPSLRVGEAAWGAAPPGTLDDPALYDGLIWRRVLGYLMDVVLIGLLWTCLWLVFGLVGLMTFGLLTPIGIVVLGVLPVAYHTWFIGTRSRTPGMAALDLEVRSWTGRRPDVFQAFLVTVLFYVTVALTAWLILAVALFNDRRRTVHDYLAGTLVVRRGRLAGLAGSAPEA